MEKEEKGVEGQVETEERRRRRRWAWRMASTASSARSVTNTSNAKKYVEIKHGCIFPPPLPHPLPPSLLASKSGAKHASRALVLNALKAAILTRDGAPTKSIPSSPSPSGKRAANACGPPPVVAKDDEGMAMAALLLLVLLVRFVSGAPK